MKQRIEPTHFIEVYGNILYNKTTQGRILHISLLNKTLKDTAHFKTLYTIAIFKIKLK